jgi:preprotein translocase subunit SecY
VFSKITLASITWVHLTILTALMITILTLLLMVVQSYFNSSEVNLLVEKAEKNDLE